MNVKMAVRPLSLIAIIIVVVSVLAGLMGSSVEALDPVLRRLSAEFDEFDPYDVQWANELHDYTSTLDDDATFFTQDEGDEKRQPKTDVIEMDDQMYREVFVSGKAPLKSWFVVFVRKRRSSLDLHDSSYIVN